MVAAESEEINKEKRVNKNAVKNIRHKEFVDILFNKKMMRQKVTRIQSKLPRTGTSNLCKTSLSCFYDKSYLLDDSINSFAYFHKDVKSQ